MPSEPKSRTAERLLRSHSPLAPDPETPYLRIFKSNVFVRDLDRSLPFYVDRLGFTVLADARLEFGRWVAVAPPDGSAILALIAPRRGTENYRLIGRPTNVSFIAEDINATYELWRARAVKFLQPPQPQLWGEPSPPLPTSTTTSSNSSAPTRSAEKSRPTAGPPPSASPPNAAPLRKSKSPSRSRPASSPKPLRS